MGANIKEMNKIIVLFILAALSLAGLHAQETFDKFEVQVDGLGCPFCAYGLEKKFKEFKGIQQVKIDIETGIFTFAYPAGKRLSLEAVEHQVEKAGYTPIAGNVTRADGTIEAMHQPSMNDGSERITATKTMRVAGNCEMCQARIEKAVLGQNGVQSASWNKDSKMLDVGFDDTVTSLEVIEKAIAKIGHDTEHHKALEDTYKNLPACCHYERIESK